MSATNTNRVSHYSANQSTPFGSQGTELWESNIDILVYNSCKLQGLLRVAKFLFMYSFTHINISFFSPTYWNCHLHKRLLPDEVMIMFPFLGADFANIPPTFFISYEIQTRYLKTLKYSEQYVQDLLSGTKVRIWICSKYDAVLNFSCIASSNLTKSFTLFHIIFIIRIRLWIFETVNLYFVCL